MNRIELLKKAKEVLDNKAKENKQKIEDESGDIEALSIATMITGFNSVCEAITNLDKTQNKILEILKLK